MRKLFELWFEGIVLCGVLLASQRQNKKQWQTQIYFHLFFGNLFAKENSTDIFYRALRNSQTPNGSDLFGRKPRKPRIMPNSLLLTKPTFVHVFTLGSFRPTPVTDISAFIGFEFTSSDSECRRRSNRMRPAVLSKIDVGVVIANESDYCGLGCVVAKGAK